MNFIYRTHAVQRMFQRDISEDIVENIIKNGEIIEKYLDDKPCPSFLVLGFSQNSPIHVVYAKDDNNVIIITAYKPNKLKWKDNYKIRIIK